MTARSRFLGGANSPPPQTASSSTGATTINNVDNDFVVIIAALLCALICVLGLIAVARCTWIHRLSDTRKNAANKGLKKKVLKSLPKLTFGADEAAKLTECPICLAEFAAGEEVRVLPGCGHAFHVGCIDTWLASHSSCPSCRQILVAAPCHKCGTVPAAATTGVQPEPRENFVNRFLH